MSKVLLATSVGQSKLYALPFLFEVVSAMGGIDEKLLVLDGIAPESVNAPKDWHVLSLPNAADITNRSVKIAHVREASRQVFLASDCTHLYWHDSDMISPVDIVPRLLAHNLPVISGVYNARGVSDPLPPVIGAFLPQTLLERVDGYGMGCFLSDRPSVEAVAFRAPDFFERGDTLGEDWQWCADANTVGVETLLDLTLPCWHASEEGRANLLTYGDLTESVTYIGRQWRVSNRCGEWTFNVPRYDVSPEEEFGPEFVRQSRLSETVVTKDLETVLTEWKESHA